MRVTRVTGPVLRRISPLALALTLAMGVFSATRVVRAQEVEVEVVRAPPPPQIEVIPVRPSPRHFWVHGYWGWTGAVHYWVPGRYEVVRPGWGWSEAHWVATGPRYHFCLVSRICG
jgi:hypothetical protein